MVGVIVAIILFVGSLGLMTAAIFDNQTNPTYANSLGVAYAGIISVCIALLGLVVSVVAYQKNKGMKLAKTHDGVWFRMCCHSGVVVFIGAN